MIAPLIVIASAIVGSISASNKVKKDTAFKPTQEPEKPNTGDNDTTPDPMKDWKLPQGVYLSSAPYNFDTIREFQINNHQLDWVTLQYLYSKFLLPDNTSSFVTSEFISQLQSDPTLIKQLPDNKYQILLNFKDVPERVLMSLYFQGELTYQEIRSLLKMPYYLDSDADLTSTKAKYYMAEYQKGNISAQNFLNLVMINASGYPPEIIQEKRTIQKAIMDVIGKYNYAPVLSPIKMSVTSIANMDSYYENVGTFTSYTKWFNDRLGSFNSLDAVKKAVFNKAHLDTQGETDYLKYTDFKYPSDIQKLVKKASAEQIDNTLLTQE